MAEELKPKLVNKAGRNSSTPKSPTLASLNPAPRKPTPDSQEDQCRQIALWSVCLLTHGFRV